MKKSTKIRTKKTKVLDYLELPYRIERKIRRDIMKEKNYRNKRVLTFDKGSRTHNDEVYYPQSRLHQCMINWDYIDNKEDDLSDDLKVLKNCRITLEWD
jgi:hypothetical protein